MINVYWILGPNIRHVIIIIMQEDTCRVNVKKKKILVNGGWTEWTDWGECTASCGGGTHKRSRTCTAPAPGEGGAPCDGQPEEEEPCGTEACGRVN